MNCSLVVREIEETAAREELSGAARLHLDACARCRKAFAERLALKSLISELPFASAPSSFDAMLRARIAARRTEKGTAKFSLATPLAGFVRFAPNAFSIALAAIFALVCGAAALLIYTGGGAPSAEIATKQRVISALPSPSISAADAMRNNSTPAISDNNQSSAKNENNRTSSGKLEAGKRSANAQTQIASSRVHSRDSAARPFESEKFNSNSSVAVATNRSFRNDAVNSARQENSTAGNITSEAFSAKSAPSIVRPTPSASDLPSADLSAGAPVLTNSRGSKIAAAFGLEGKPTSGREEKANEKNNVGGAAAWLVTSVAKDGIAARAGLREGDLIETVNDQPAWSSASPLRAAFETGALPSSGVWRLRVRRGGETIELSLSFSDNR